MTNPNAFKSPVEEAYDSQLAHLRRQLIEASQLLANHEQRHLHDPESWALVGDLNRAGGPMSELLAAIANPQRA